MRKPLQEREWLAAFVVTIFSLGLIFLGYFVSSRAAYAATEVTGSMSFGAAMGALAFEIIFLATALFFLFRLGEPPRLGKFLPALAWGVCGGAAILALDWLFTWLSALTGLKVGLNPDFIPRARNEWIGWVVTLPFVAVGEELFFRGLLPALYRAVNAPAGLSLGLACALFGLIHLGEGVIAVPIAALLALIFFFLKNKSGGLLAPIIAHLLVDTAGLVLTAHGA